MRYSGGYSGYGDPYGFSRSLGRAQARENEVFKALRERGIAKVEVGYSGYNDEGGAEDIDLFDAKGQRIGYVGFDTVTFWALTPKQKRVKFKTHRDTNAWGQPQAFKCPVVGEKIEGEEAEKIREVLEGPVEEDFGGWGGETRVYGTYEWDVNTGRGRYTEQHQDSWHSDY